MSKVDFKRQLKYLYRPSPKDVVRMASGKDYDLEDKANRLWTLTIMQPEHISSDLVAQAVENFRAKKGRAGLEKTSFSRFTFHWGGVNFTVSDPKKQQGYRTNSVITERNSFFFLQAQPGPAF